MYRLYTWYTLINCIFILFTCANCSCKCPNLWKKIFSSILLPQTRFVWSDLCIYLFRLAAGFSMQRWVVWICSYHLKKTNFSTCDFFFFFGSFCFCFSRSAYLFFFFFFSPKRKENASLGCDKKHLIAAANRQWFSPFLLCSGLLYATISICGSAVLFFVSIPNKMYYELRTEQNWQCWRKTT